MSLAACVAVDIVNDLTESNEDFLKLLCKGCPGRAKLAADDVDPEDEFCLYVDSGKNCLKENYLKNIEEAIREALE